ncbi:hypothetical protein BGZ52_006578 [Haplosporangium bisporale]|nr:hypothetical protein BGZ52_006578 [Haplosporangium bisporale]KFH73376.1 hypothetical protein MVEG_00592 [Podila verticillata NRRL 6337]
MAALDDSVLDPMTNRPLKVLVCKDHVPTLKHSSNVDSLSLSHTTSAPKPSTPGLHRALMGERGVGHSDDANNERQESPRSLDQGSHGLIMKGMGLTPGSSTKPTTETEKISGHSRSTSASSLTGELKSMPTSTLPKFRSGRFTISAEEDSLLSAAEAQDPTKDDDSFRNLPVRHDDYDQEEDNKQERVFTLKGQSKNLSSSSGDHSFLTNEDKKGSHEVEVSLETEEDVEQRVHKEHSKVDLKDYSQVEEAEIKAPTDEDKKLVDLAFRSKMLGPEELGPEELHKDESHHKAIEEDEWDAPTDSVSRREAVAGM